MHQITSKSELFAAIEQIHIDCFKLCKQAIGRYLPVAGNVGVFCHYSQEYDLLTKIREELTEPSTNPNQKYYLLCEPITIRARGDMPKTAYTHLYIRKPDPSPAGRCAGDIDFVLSDEAYASLKASIVKGTIIKGAQIYDRPGWDMIELADPSIGSVAYIGTDLMTKRLRVRF